MFFQIVKRTIAEDEVEGLDWIYRQGTEKNPGEAVCHSARYFASEEDARRDIAMARKGFAGARFAKVC